MIQKLLVGSRFEMFDLIGQNAVVAMLHACVPTLPLHSATYFSCRIDPGSTPLSKFFTTIRTVPVLDARGLDRSTACASAGLPVFGCIEGVTDPMPELNHREKSSRPKHRTCHVSSHKDRPFMSEPPSFIN